MFKPENSPIPSDDPDAEDAVRSLMVKHRGRMTIEQLGLGIKACLSNGRALVREAQLLLKNNMYARAMSLSMTANEEVGKAGILRSMVRIPATNQKLWLDRWNLFRSHENKTAYASVDTLPDDAYLYPELVLAVSVDSHFRAPVSERIRQSGLYVDWYPWEKKWLNPCKEITEQMARSRMEIAKAGLARVGRFCEQGWFCPEVLQLEHDILGPLNDEMPKQTGVTQEQVQDLWGRFPKAFREFLRAVIGRKLLHLPDDFMVAGVPWREFIRCSE
jgi:AbiV family abortive infection protein